MLSFFATVFSIKWITEHQTEAIFFALFIISLIIYFVSKKKHAARNAAVYQQQLITAQDIPTDNPPQDEKPSPTISAPDHIDNNTIQYQYHDVIIIPENNCDDASTGDHLELKISEDSVLVYHNNTAIGKLRENRLAGMVRDWENRGDPFLAYFVKNTDSGPMIALFFYSNALEKFLSMYTDAKLVKLTGKPEDFASYSIGMYCDIEQDLEVEKYSVLCNGDLLGYLPSSAINYANKHDIYPESLHVIIGDINYDDDKDRDIISVYISE